MVDLPSEIPEAYDFQENSESDESKRDTDGKLIVLGTDHSYTHKVIWPVASVYLILHIGAAFGLYLCIAGKVKMATMLWTIFYSYVSVEGAHMGAHRCFSHRSFKPKPLLKALLLIIQASGGQGSAYMWGRNHRQHHRYSDTDGDPHNSKRGQFYAHMGWLMTSRHPICKELRKTIDTSDLLQDKLVMFQYNYFLSIFFLFGFLLPMWVPMHFFGETFVNSFFVCFLLRFVYSLHVTWFVNSLAHKYGTRPFDKTIQPVEAWLVSLTSLGEGWHNYHHAFPWDYKAAEIGSPFNITASLIRFFGSIGLATDLKSVDSDMLYKRIKSKGDGTFLSEHLEEKVTAIGPVHRMNPTYRGNYADPDVKLKVRLYKRIKSKGDGTFLSEHLEEKVTAIGPVHRMNPTYRGNYADPDVKLKVRVRS